MGLIVTSFTPTATGFTATFSKPFVNTTTSPIHIYDAASAGYGAAEVTLVGPSPSTASRQRFADRQCEQHRLYLHQDR